MTVTAIHAHRLTPLFAIKAKTWTDELLDTLLIFLPISVFFGVMVWARLFISYLSH